MGVLGHLGVFGVVWGRNSKISKGRQIILQNEALGHVIPKKMFLEVTKPQMGGICGHSGSK